MDEEIVKTVQSMFGCDVNIVDCEKTSTVAQEEQIMINGVPIKLDGMSEDDASAIKQAFKNGELPSFHLLNELLQQAGIIQQAVQLETSVSVKSSITTKEEVLVSKAGVILNERTHETKEDYIMKSHTKELLQPAIKTKFPELLSLKQSNSREPRFPSGFSLRISPGTDCNNTLDYDKTHDLYSKESNYSTYPYSDLSNNDDISRVDSCILDESIQVSNNSNSLNKSSSFKDSQTMENVQSNASPISRKSDCTTKQEEHDVNTLDFKEDNLISGSVEKIILHMIPTSSYYPDDKFIELFLLCSEAFITPREIVSKCIQVWSVHLKNGTHRNGLINHIIRFLRKWYNTCPEHFDSIEFQEELAQIAKRHCITLNYEDYEEKAPMMPAKVGESEFFDKNFHILISAVTKTNQSTDSSSENNLGEIATEKFQQSKQHTKKIHCIWSICDDPKDLSQQLTAIELNFLCRINRTELVEFLTRDNFKNAFTFGSHTQSTPIQNYMLWFDHLKFIVATGIVKTLKKKKRIRIIDFWIDTACECFNAGNFNSLMAIIMAFKMPAVARLKKTWSKVYTAKLAVLQDLFDQDINFVSYRMSVKAALWRSKTTVKENCLVIPFFNLLLQDMHQLLGCCIRRQVNQHINIEKCAEFCSLLIELNILELKLSNLKITDTLVTYLDETTRYESSDTLLSQSYLCEAAQDVDEKHNYKMLKTESKCSTPLKSSSQ